MADFLQHFFAYPLNELPFVFLALVIGFTLHEFAHAYVAEKLGDSTAHELGRVTLNPRKHIDVLGMFFFLIASIGYAKAVPVNRERFKYPRLMGLAATLAGPMTNLLLAIIGMLVSFAFYHIEAFHWLPVGVHVAVGHFLYYTVSLNLLIFLLSFLPLPPLDGFRIIEDVIPQSTRSRVANFHRWAIFVFLLLVFVDPLHNFVMDPIFGVLGKISATLNAMLNMLFGITVDWSEMVSRSG